MKHLGRLLDILLGNPSTMTPEELEERVESLEIKVEANKAALQKHEQTRHPSPDEDRLDQ